jgi:hypothetical protein
MELISRRASFGAGKKPSVKGCGADIRHLDPPESSDPHSKAGSQLSLATATRGPVQGLQGSVRGYPFEDTPFLLADKVGRRGGAVIRVGVGATEVGPDVAGIKKIP